MEAPSLPSVGYPCSGQPAPWQQSLFIQPNSELGKETLFAKPSCPGAHLFLLGDAGKLGGFQACPEFFQSLHMNAESLPARCCYLLQSK